MEITSDFNCHHNEQLNGIRSIRKFLRASNNITTETNNGVYINLIARYFWYQNENNNICCHIEIGWEPWYINNGVPNKWTSQGANNFSQSNCSTLKINGNIITDSSPIAAPIGNSSNMIYYDNGNIKPVEITNNYQSLYCFHITTASTDKNINIEYKYEYESSGTIYSVDFTDNNSLKIYRPSKYDDNFVFNRKGLNELIKNIKEYPIIDATNITEEGISKLRIFSGNPRFNNNNNYKDIEIGSGIIFSGATAASNPQPTGTFRITTGNVDYDVPICGFNGNNAGNITLNGNTIIEGHLLPSKDADINNNEYEWNIGSITDNDPDTPEVQMRRWNNLYLAGDIGTSSYPINALYARTISTTGAININSTNDGITGTTDGNNLPNTISKNTSASIYTQGGICAEYNIWARRVFNAVFNDYAEYRTTINLTPGHVVIDQDNGSLICSSERLQPGAQVISDTFGHSMGATDTAKTPLAVAGRVLVYTYQPRENYHAGMAVCSAPNGTVDIMTREEIRDYPDCIVGIVSEIPEYETWGSDNVKINKRIWIKVK